MVLMCYLIISTVIFVNIARIMIAKDIDNFNSIDNDIEDVNMEYYIEQMEDKQTNEK